MMDHVTRNGENPHFLLDISRLIARAGQSVPTGIDRVELAYANFLLSHHSANLTFSAMHPVGRYGTLPFGKALALINVLNQCWDGQGGEAACARLGRSLRRHALLGRAEKISGKVFHLLLSHHHLNRPKVVSRVLRRYRARFIPMIHDLIPIEYPEYARPIEPVRHERRLATVSRYADGIIVPSEDVAVAMQERLRMKGRVHVPVWTVPHGIHKHPLPEKSLSADTRVPYFVYLGTIEPRKNHLLLLNIWRRLVQQLGEKAPKLIIVGKRGWENENIVDMLERCPWLQNHVEEHNSLPDTEVVRLLCGSRALLFPSFVEGFGLPLAEALSLNVPAICSDIPVFRTIAQKSATYIDPLDAKSWEQAILDFTFGDDHTANLPKKNNWAPFEWDSSVSMALDKIVLS